YHVAIERDLTLAKRRQVYHRAQAATNQPLNFNRAAALFACARPTPRPFRARARQLAVLPGDPTTSLALEPRWEPRFQTRVPPDLCIAEFHEAGTLGIFDPPPLERNRAKLIDLSAARPHRKRSLILLGHHTHTPGLNKTAPIVNSWLVPRR